MCTEVSEDMRWWTRDRYSLACSNMTVTTRHSSSPVATRLEYDNTGMISTRTSCAREVSVCEYGRYFRGMVVSSFMVGMTIMKAYVLVVHYP